jgi:tRNA modification GTPase
LVWTKADLHAPSGDELLAAQAKLGAVASVPVSAETGEGLETLVRTISDLATAGAAVEHDAPILTHERHRYAVSRALDETSAFRDRWVHADVPAPVAAVHLREAVRVLEDLVGAVDVEDILEEVFKRFCVGK